MGTLNNIVDSLTQEKEKKTSGSSSWVGALVAALMVILFTGILGYLTWRKGSKLAELLHERALAEEEKHRAEIESRLAQLQEERDEALERVAESQERLKVLRQQQEQLQQEHHDLRSKIDSISSWDDVDSYLGR